MGCMVVVIAPLCGQSVAALGSWRDQLRVVEIRLGDQRERPADGFAEAVGSLRHLLQEVLIARIDESVDGIEPQPIDVVVIHPHQGVADDVFANLGLSEVNGGAPRVGTRVVEVRPELRQVVSARPEMVVHDILDDAQAALVAGVDEPLVGGGAAIALMDRVPEHAVIAPVVGPVESVDRQDFDEVDSEPDEVIEPCDGRIEGALWGVRADVQFVDRGACELTTGPCGVTPLVGAGVETAGKAVYSFGLSS